MAIRTWKELAQAARTEGYVPGPWQALLRSHLMRLFPELVTELRSKGDLESYLQVKTWSALDYQETMIEQGTPPDLARSEALEQLLPRPSDELDRPSDWERESAEADSMEAAQRFLTQPPPKNP